MGSTAHHVGPLGSGALAKLATNALLGAHVAALAEVVTLLRRQHCDLPTLLRAVATTPVWAPVDHYLAGSMLSGDFSPQFPVTLMAKDFAYALDAAGGAPHAPTLAAVRALFERGVDLGLGEENMTGVIRALGV
jgi:3-hydroxyisobutyrate dehydrogenase